MNLVWLFYVGVTQILICGICCTFYPFAHYLVGSVGSRTCSISCTTVGIFT
jgi:hypothetical protein